MARCVRKHARPATQIKGGAITGSARLQLHLRTSSVPGASWRLPVPLELLSSALAVLAVLGLVFELFAALLDVLAGAGHGVAGGQGGDREQADESQGNDALHEGLPSDVMPARHVRGWAPLFPVARRPGVNPLLTFQSRIRVDLPNRLSTRSTASSAVALRVSSTGLSSTMSSEPRRPVSAIISITSCASR